MAHTAMARPFLLALLHGMARPRNTDRMLLDHAEIPAPNHIPWFLTGQTAIPGRPVPLGRQAHHPAGTHKASLRPLSTQMVGDSLHRMMVICDANVRHFSGISARKGGLSTAITAGVTEEILFLQSGHGQARAARNYIHLQDPTRLIDTFRAFGL
jgi:hypothetical protein